MRVHPVFRGRFRIQNGKKIRVRIYPEAIASQLPTLCREFQLAAEQYRAGAHDPQCTQRLAKAVTAICVCFFGEAQAALLIDGWRGNYVGFAAEMAGFCTKRLGPMLKRYAKHSIRRYRAGRLL